MKKWLILATLAALAIFLIAVGSPAQQIPVVGSAPKMGMACPPGEAAKISVEYPADDSAYSLPIVHATCVDAAFSDEPPVITKPVISKPKTRVLLGADGGYLFGNGYIGVLAGIEQPIGRHFEADGYFRFDPLESHIALGEGWAEQGKVKGIWWLNRRVGLDGAFEESSYHVSISKAGYYAFGGVTLRGRMFESPTRFTFDYAQEVRNGIDKTGTETGHLRGGVFRYDARLGCAKATCFRMAQEFWVGRVLGQGNPACDGTYGITGGPNGGPCPRQGTLSGGVDSSFVLEWPRRRNTEDELW